MWALKSQYINMVFSAKRSTVTHLSIIQFLCEKLDTKYQVDVIYADLSKAFDRVDYRILIQKLQNFGLSSNSLSFVCGV